MYRTYLESHRQGREILHRLSTVNSLRRGLGEDYKRTRRGDLAPHLMLDTEIRSKRHLRRSRKFYYALQQQLGRWEMLATALAETQEDSSHLIEIIRERFETDRSVLSVAIRGLNSHEEMFNYRERLEASPIRWNRRQRLTGQRQGLYVTEVHVSRLMGMTGSFRVLEDSQGGLVMTLRPHLVIAEDDPVESETGADCLIRANLPSPFDYTTYPHPSVFGQSGHENSWNSDQWPLAPDYPTRNITRPTDQTNSRMMELQRRLEFLCQANPPESTERLLALQARSTQGTDPLLAPRTRSPETSGPSLD